MTESSESREVGRILETAIEEAAVLGVLPLGCVLKIGLIDVLDYVFFFFRLELRLWSF